MSNALRRTTVPRVRIRRLGFSFIAIALLSGSTCPKDESACGDETGNAWLYFSPVEALGSPDLETTLSGNERTFSWSRLIENVCSQEHADANWLLTVNPNKLPPGWRVEAGYLVTALVGSTVTLTAAPEGDRRKYTGKTDIGLSQAFGEGPGRFLVFLDLSFTSQGDLTTDREVLRGFVFTNSVEWNYKRHKSN